MENLASYNKEKVKMSQQRLLEMALVVKDILENNHIPYFLAQGSLLGAVRDGRFIPWDDDLDLYLFEDGYSHALRILRESLPDDLFLEDKLSEPLYFHDWAHIKDLTTECTCEQFPQDSYYAHKGLSIDLYIMYQMEEKNWPKFKYDKAIEYLRTMRSNMLISEEQYKVKAELFHKQYIDRLHVVNDSTEIVFGSTVSSRIYKTEDILPLSSIEFEGYRFNAPNSCDGYLRTLYNNYMLLPPVEKRVPHYSSVIFK